jgi:PKD repeat protein
MLEIMRTKITFLVLFSIIGLSSVFAQIPTEGLVGYWPFTGNANDESGNGNNGTVNNATLVTDRFGNLNSAYWFNGTNAFIEVPESTSLNSTSSGDLTFTCWIEYGNLNNCFWLHYRIINGTGGGVGYSIEQYLSKICYNNWPGTSFISDLTNIIPGNWYFVCVTLDVSENLSKLFLNANQVGSCLNPLVVPTPQVFINFGRNCNTGSFAQGSLDDIRIYSRTLNDQEIQELFNENQPPVSLNANFSATPLEGVAPLNVQFTDESAGNPSVWIWDFQNDGVNDAFIQNPTFFYEEPGIYSVKLIVINSTEMDTLVKENYITVNQGSNVEGLVAYYPFNGNANDESGNGNNGTVNGAILTSDRFGNPNSAYYFNGINDYIDIGSFPVNAFTFAGWIYCENINQSNLNAIISRMNYAYPGGFEFRVEPDSRLQMVVADQGGFNNTYTDAGINTNQWYFVVSTYDSSNVKIYVNSNLVGSNPCGFNLISGGEIDFGTRPNNGIHDGWFNGVIDDFRIFNRALSGEEILEFFLENQISTPEICIVSVTPDEHNKIIWEKQTTTDIESYNVYRETTQANVFEQIGNVPFQDSSVFVDMTSNPLQRPYKYKASAFSTSGTETPLSNYHKTIHLTINQGPSGWNLIWSSYEGLLFNTYYIYRGTAPDELVLFDSISGSFNSYTDINPPAGSLFYAIEIINEEGCFPTKDGGYSRSRSNVQFNGVVEIEDYSETGIKIYPNPANEILNIEIANNNEVFGTEMSILDIHGKKIISHSLSTAKSSINIKDFKPGVYILKVDYQQKILTKKLMVY